MNNDDDDDNNNNNNNTNNNMYSYQNILNVLAISNIKLTKLKIIKRK